jgi:protein phosphatase
MSCAGKTIDLSIERGYAIEVPDWYGIQIGKVHGMGARSNQEDAFGISEIEEEQLMQKGLLAVLADGMGGMQSGEKASAAAVISCLQFFEQNELPSGWMKEMVLDANEAAIDALGTDTGAGGTTLIAVHIDGNLVNWISVGDSHLYLYREGVLKQLNHDHNYAAVLQKEVENGEISEEEALKHKQRKALTSYIGMRDLEEIDDAGERLVLQKGDWLLLMTDGIFGTLSEEEITSQLSYMVGKAAMCIQMEIDKKQKKNQDNYTGILIKFDE